LQAQRQATTGAAGVAAAGGALQLLVAHALAAVIHAVLATPSFSMAQVSCDSKSYLTYTAPSIRASHLLAVTAADVHVMLNVRHTAPAAAATGATVVIDA
jgi:hypothetical protein